MTAIFNQLGNKFFRKFISTINSVRSKPEQISSYDFDNYSRFQEFLFFVDEDDESYESVKLAVMLCDTALNLSRNRASLNKKSKEYALILDEVECYKQLNDEEAKELKNLIAKFHGLIKERNTLRFQMGDFDRGLYKLIDLEQSAPKDIKQIEEAESKERTLEQDIHYLRDEKNNLENEKDNLEFGIKFLHYFNIVMVIIFATSVSILMFLNLFKGKVVFFPLSILCVALIVLYTIVYILRRRIQFEIRLNTKKQMRAVNLLNKKLANYSWYRSFLDYEYKKYNVKSAAMLRTNLKDFSRYKYVTSRYDKIRSIMYETQKLLEDFLREKKIKDVNASIESFAKTIDIDDKVEYARRISEKKELLDAKINELDKKHEKIWDELISLNLNDDTQNKVIEKLIKVYLEEVGKVNCNDFGDIDIEALEADLAEFSFNKEEGIEELLETEKNAESSES